MVQQPRVQSTKVLNTRFDLRIEVEDGEPIMKTVHVEHQEGEEDGAEAQAVSTFMRGGVGVRVDEALVFYPPHRVKKVTCIRSKIVLAPLSSLPTSLVTQ